MNTNIKYNQNLYLLLVFSFIIRIVAVYYYGDTTIEYEWKTILKNLNEHGTLSLYSFDGWQVPSVFMPPLYIFFLFTINFFTPENIKLAKIVLAIQVILSTLSIFMFFKLCTFFFSKNWSIFNSLLLSIFPLNIYTTTQISSITLQILLLFFYLNLFFLLYKSNKNTYLYIFLFSLVSGMLILLRGEFYLIFIISLFYLFIFKKLNFKKNLIILLVSLLVISPYLIRNYYNFERIALTKSLGFNLWKGNNPFATVEGSLSYEAHVHDNMFEKIENLPKDKLYEFYHDDLFLNEGIKHIKNEPMVFIKRYVKRFLSFFYFNINSDYPDYYHPLFIVPIILISFFSTAGIWISIKELNFEKGYLILHLFLIISIFSLFFILPRYKMMILPLQLIFANYFFISCLRKDNFVYKFFKNKN